MIVHVSTPPIIRLLASQIESAGGQAVLVGGAPIDVLNDRTPKDWDIEVFNLSFGRLQEIFAERSGKMVGKEFGILKLSAKKCDGLDIDLNVPRRDNHVGLGHNDLVVDLVPNMSKKEACRRRDFTINAMGVDMHTGELIDPFGGMADLAAGILRATDPELFKQDGLRPLRAMQLLARKAKMIDPATMLLIRDMVDMFPNLAKARVHEEFRKLLLKAPSPSVGIEFLRESGWIKHFPALADQIGCEQHPDWHPEGDVHIHSMHTVDSAAWVRDQNVLPDGWTEAFMFATLCHDVGKPSTTVFQSMIDADLFPQERLFTAWGHDRVGMPIVESFLRQMMDNKDVIEKTRTIVGEHMQPWNLLQGEARKPGWKRLHNRLRLDVLGWMCRCDHCGGPHRHIGEPDFEHETSQMCWDHFSEFGEEPIKPVLMGRHLIKAGLKPGEDFGRVLKVAFEAQIEDESLSLDALLKIAQASI